MDDIYVADLDGSNVANLTHTPIVSEQEPDFSPDGSKICFTLHSGSREVARIAGADSIPKSALGIYVMNADGSDPTLLAGKRSGGCDWSPDGTRIAFESNRDGGLAIYTMKPDGSDVTQLTTNLGGDFEPTWQPLPGTTVDQPDTGGSSLLLVASALLFSGGVLLYAGVKRWM